MSASNWTDMERGKFLAGIVFLYVYIQPPDSFFFFFPATLLETIFDTGRIVYSDIA